MDPFGSRKEHDDASGCYALPEPTACRPGSAGKIAELSRRFNAGLQLWHPNDDDHVQYRFRSSSRNRPIDYAVVREAARQERLSRQERQNACLLLIRLLRDVSGKVRPAWLS